MTENRERCHRDKIMQALQSNKHSLDVECIHCHFAILNHISTPQLLMVIVSSSVLISWHALRAELIYHLIFYYASNLYLYSVNLSALRID